MNKVQEVGGIAVCTLGLAKAPTGCLTDGFRKYGVRKVGVQPPESAILNLTETAAARSIPICRDESFLLLICLKLLWFYDTYLQFLWCCIFYLLQMCFFKVFSWYPFWGTIAYFYRLVMAFYGPLFAILRSPFGHPFGFFGRFFGPPFAFFYGWPPSKHTG